MSGRKCRSLHFFIVLLPLIAILAGSSQGDFAQIGVGAHYWTALDDIDADEMESDGLAWYLTARLLPDSLVSIGLEIEQFPDDYGGSPDTVYAPAAYLIVGQGVYGAIGVGGYYTDGDFAADPFYALRVGLITEALPSIYLDINANYRFDDWNDLDNEDQDIDTDTVTLGAAIRIQF